MSILKVSRLGHPVLRRLTDNIPLRELQSAEMQKFIDDMVETMHEYHGVGLAAPQVHESLRVFVAHLDAEGRGSGEPIAIINPEIEIVGHATIEGWEGCLSIPDIRGLVPRLTDVTMRALDRDGRTIQLRLRDFPARVAQHETDHLDGVLFFDRMTSLQSLTFLDEYSRYHAKDGD